MQLDTVTFAWCGPGLIAAASATALFFVNHKLSRSRHAMLWAFAFAGTALQWLVHAVAGVAAPELEPVAALIGTGGLLLLVEGFHVRHGGRSPTAGRVMAGTAVLLATAGLAVRPVVDWATEAAPAMAGMLFVLAARDVPPAGRRANVAEGAVAALLLTLAAGKLLLAGLGASGVDPAVRTMLAVATWMPTAAATGLATLLLIASDLSVELRRILHTDPLTGVLNRAGFEERAHAALARAGGRPMTLAVADIDLFKDVNDRFGHAVGDAALACVAAHLRQVAGRDDVLGRIGGEEFAILFRNNDGDATLDRIERARADLPEMCMRDRPEVRITASFGLAERACGGEPLAAMIERADRALYRSKRAGRNRATLAEAEA